MNSPVNSIYPKHGRIRALVNCRKMLAGPALVLALLLPNMPMPAQVINAAQPAHRSSPRFKRQSLDERVELLARYLDLNDEQRSALKKILLENQQEILKMRHAPSRAEGLQMDRFRAIEDKTMERIRAMLTEEQRTKYEPLGVRNPASASQNVSVDDWLKVTRPQ
jgi:hypothetical protein